jgi:signal transduction histidine kinase
VTCGYAGPDQIDLPNADTASQFYRIAQEAATNAAKHGRGGQIVIQLASHREGVQLSVRDNGRGLPEPSGNSIGAGLDIMRYRAGMIGATLTIESQPGQGTTVKCFAPRPMPEASAPHA